MSVNMAPALNPSAASGSRLVPRLRLALAVVVAPAIPMAWVALQTSGSLWAPFVYLWGYIVFAVSGAPLLAYAYVRRRLLACVTCGGVAAVLPLLLISSLSMFRTLHATSQTATDLGSLFALGCVGGAVFWLISFWEPRGLTQRR